MDVSKEIAKVHNKLLIDINEMTDHDSSEFENFNTALGTYLQKGALSRNKTITAKIKALTTKGIVKHGDYSKLKEAASASENQDIVDRIETAEQAIKDIYANSIKNQEESDRAESNQSTSQPPIQESSSSECNGKKRKTEDDQADPLYYQDNRQRGYYDTRGKKGYLLILNSRENREGTEKDVESLKNFFGKELGFEVDDPRTYMHSDLTLREISDCLESARQTLNNALSSKYYCFICVILSHGNEDGIKAKDGLYKSEEVQKIFNNRHMPNFAGKPKLFFIQACRGQVAQDGVQVDEADDEPSDAPVDLDDVIHNIPWDADTLMAYATTPGYKSFRRLGVGSWFLKECVEVFRRFRGEDHVEEMLITVRENVAHNWEKADGSKQMPCVWSSLTKRLRLTNDGTKL